MISTTMVAISPAAMTSWPSGLDIPVGSIPAVCPAPRRVAVLPAHRTPAPGCARDRSGGFIRAGPGSVGSCPVRLTEFRGLMQAQFGPLRAPSVAQDHVFAALDGRTADEALAAGEDPKVVWLAVCDDFDIVGSLRFGLPD